jgi:hypothetical protein
MTSEVVDAIRDIYVEGTQKYIKLSKVELDKVSDYFIAEKKQNPEFKQINMMTSKKNKFRQRPNDECSRTIAMKIKLATKLQNKHPQDV